MKHITSIINSIELQTDELKQLIDRVNTFNNEGIYSTQDYIGLCSELQSLLDNLSESIEEIKLKATPTLKECHVTHISNSMITFSNGFMLKSDHEQDCCEDHYLCFSDLEPDDFKGLSFNLNDDNFFKRIKGYGIELVPVHGHSVKIPGYGSQNGYYSDNLELVILSPSFRKFKTFNITDCQDITYE